jgi:hypothetical protein
MTAHHAIDHQIELTKISMVENGHTSNDRMGVFNRVLENSTAKMTQTATTVIEEMHKQIIIVGRLQQPVDKLKQVKTINQAVSHVQNIASTLKESLTRVDPDVHDTFGTLKNTVGQVECIHKTTFTTLKNTADSEGEHIHQTLSILTQRLTEIDEYISKNAITPILPDYQLDRYIYQCLDDEIHRTVRTVQNMVGKVDIHKSAEIFEKQVVYATQNITKTVNNRNIELSQEVKNIYDNVEFLYQKVSIVDQNRDVFQAVSTISKIVAEVEGSFNQAIRNLNQISFNTDKNINKKKSQLLMMLMDN